MKFFTYSVIHLNQKINVELSYEDVEEGLGKSGSGAETRTARLKGPIYSLRSRPSSWPTDQFP